jgi:hypothetical protein
MPIKKEHTAFSAYGYKDWGTMIKKDNTEKLKRERIISISINNGRSQTEVGFTVDEAKQILDEIIDAIKQSKKNHDPLF